MAEPATADPHAFRKTYDAMSLQLEHAENILDLVLASEPDEIMPALAVISEKLAAVRELAHKLDEIGKGT